MLAGVRMVLLAGAILFPMNTGNNQPKAGTEVVVGESRDMEVLEAVPVDIEQRLNDFGALIKRVQSGEIVLGPKEIREVAKRAGALGALMEHVKTGTGTARNVLETVVESLPEVVQKTAEIGADSIVGRVLRRRGVVSAKVNQIRIGMIAWLARDVAKDAGFTNLPSFLEAKAA